MGFFYFLGWDVGDEGEGEGNLYDLNYRPADWSFSSDPFFAHTHQYLLVVIVDGVLFFVSYSYLLHCWVFAGVFFFFFPFLFSPRDPISHFRACLSLRVVFMHHRRETYTHFHGRDAGRLTVLSLLFWSGLVECEI